MTAAKNDTNVHKLENYQICELPKIDNLNSISIPLIRCDGQSPRNLTFNNVYIFDIHGVPDEQFEAEDINGFSTGILKGKKLHDFLILRDWNFRKRDGSYDLPTELVYTTLFSTFSLRILSESMSLL